jgi:antitoxin component HigA of HigAB toxin-antitoxin module
LSGFGAPKKAPPKGDKLEVLTTLVEAYEDRYYPVPDADPIDILFLGSLSESPS